jgi:hypothetical protein
MRRSYEHEFSGIRGGFLQPGEITKKGGQVVDPRLIISQAFKDGDTCYMRFGASFQNDSKATAKIVAHGVPSNYISPFNQRAYYPTIASSVNCSGALQQRAALITQNNLVVSRCERLLHKKHVQRGEIRASEEELLAAKFRILMNGGDLEFDENTDHDLDGDGVTDADEMRLQAAQMEYAKFRMPELNEERDAIVLVLQKHLNMLNDVFQYFAAYGSNTESTELATISRNEFWHFLNHCKVFSDLNAVRQQAIDIFQLVNVLHTQGRRNSAPGADDTRCVTACNARSLLIIIRLASCDSPPPAHPFSSAQSLPCPLLPTHPARCLSRRSSLSA